MFWKRKPVAAAVIPPAPARGIFSTDAFLESLDPTDSAQRLAKAIGKSIQRTHADLKTVRLKADGSGQETVAMDEAYPDLQLVKWQNSVGNGTVNETQLAYFAENGFIGYQTAALIAQHWLIDKACTMPARDAVRHGYEITANEGVEIKPEAMEYLKRRDKQMLVKKNCVEFIRFGRIFGIRHCLFIVESSDPMYYEKPFNIDAVKPGSYKGMCQIDPYWVTPVLDFDAAANPLSMHFYEPTWWQINGKKIHRTHFVITRNSDEMADILKPSYFYGGVPVPQKIAERVFAAERTANEAPMLALTKRLVVLKTDMAAVVADLPQFLQKLNWFSTVWNNYGTRAVDKDAEEIEYHDTSLTDMDALIMTQYQLVAATAEVPATKLLGTSPKGFGAAGDYEVESYGEFLESIQEHDLTPLITRHHSLLIKSELIKKFGGEFIETDLKWAPVDTPTAKEQAEINKTKADTDNVLVQAGALDGLDIRNRLINDNESGYNGIEAIVDGGPGDREAMQEADQPLESAVQSSNKAKAAE